jgi:hypothetical protein
MSVDNKLLKRQLKLIDAEQSRLTFLRLLENPVIELTAGFALCEYLRTVSLSREASNQIMSDTRTSILGGLYFKETTTTASDKIPLFRPSALNWLEAGLLISVLTQQMKDNPNAQQLGQAGIGALGQLGSSAIGTVGNVLKTGINAIGGAAMLAGAV